MANGFNNQDFAVNLPNLFGTPGESLDSAIALQQRRGEQQMAKEERDRAFAERMREFDIREGERRLRDEAGKVDLILKLTDLQKYQTSSDVVNALGSDLMAKEFPKFLEMAKAGVSDADLVGKIKQTTDPIVRGMAGAKLDLDAGEELYNNILKTYPNVDREKLLKDIRTDVVNRRLGQGNFVNPNVVAPSELYQNLISPDYISNYVTSASPLRDFFLKDKGQDVEVTTGGYQQNTKLKGSKRFFEKLNFDPNIGGKDIDATGFLKRGVTPLIEIDTEEVSPNDLPAASKVPFKMIGDAAYQQIISNPVNEAILSRMARDQFGDTYDQLDDREKTLVKKRAALQFAETLPKGGFQTAGTVRAPVSLTRINVGGDKSDVNIRDIYKNIESEVDKREVLEAKDGKKRATPLNVLDAKSQNLIISAVKPLMGDVDQSEIMLDRDEKTGRMAVYKVAEGTTNIRGDKVTFLDELDVNIPAQVGVKEKREAVKQANKGTVRVSLNGNIGEIPASQLDAFMKKYPNAKKL